MDKSNRTGGFNGDIMGIEPSFIMGFGMGYSGHQTWLAGNLPFSSMIFPAKKTSIDSWVIFNCHV